MDLKIKGRVAIITGAGRGIGKATALTFAREGANLALNDLDEESVKQTAEEARALGVDSIYALGNVCD